MPSLSKEHRRYAFGFLAVSFALLAIGGYLLFLHTTIEKRTTSDLLRADDLGAEFVDLDGHVLRLGDYYGRPVLIYSWASWSPQCMTALPLLGEIARERGDTLPVLAVNRKEVRSVIDDYLSYIGKPEGLRYVTDVQDAFYTSNDGRAMPLLMLYDREGKIVRTWESDIKKEELTASVDELLK